MAAMKPVVVSLNDLKNGGVSSETLQEAFGPESLGILVVKDLPEEFMSLRKQLLSYASYMGNLDQSELDQLTNEAAKYLVGWSLGREKLGDGGADNLKGSFYANCAFYLDPTRNAAPPSAQFTLHDFPEYLAPNVWPRDEVLPGFKTAMELLCNLIIDAGVLVARACDRFAEEEIEDYPRGYLERVVQTSSTTKARLLHYYPMTEEASATVDEGSWCALHKDHGCLTGLTSAMFVDEMAVNAKPPRINGHTETSLPPLEELMQSPDPLAGLWIKSRKGEPQHVKIPRDCIAFQTGEALETITRGRFKAVEHSVRGSFAKGVARNTLAVFTQPNLEEVVDLDKKILYGNFAREIIAKNTI